MFESNNVMRLAGVSTHPAPISHTHRVYKTQHLALIRISKPGLRILRIKAKQPQILPGDMINCQCPAESGELYGPDPMDVDTWGENLIGFDLSRRG